MRSSRLVVFVAVLLFGSCRGREPAGTTPGEPARTEPVQLTSGPGVEIFPAFSPDGLSVAYCSNETGAFELFVLPIRSGAAPRRITSDGRQNLQPTWSPDGKASPFTRRIAAESG